MFYSYFNPTQDLDRLHEALEIPYIQEAYDRACREYLHSQIESIPLRESWANGLLSLDRLLIPADINTVDTEWDEDLEPELWHDFVAHGACHWFAIPYIFLAEHLYPELTWDIYTSDDHTAVIDSTSGMIFDLVYMAYEVPTSSVLNLIDITDPVDLTTPESA
ncbi:hypothetical protein N9137_03395 [Pseudomonadales bacterium]|nr:hypothetical protein [Pseudomonadales bacterium]